jgi:hypothetical protein
MNWRTVSVCAAVCIAVSITMSLRISAMNYPGNKWSVVPDYHLDEQTKSILKSLRNPEIGQRHIVPPAERLLGLPEAPGLYRPERISGEYFLDNASQEVFKSLRSSGIAPPRLMPPLERAQGLPDSFAPRFVP